MSRPELEIHDLLNAQTGRIAWPELARHFARGAVVVVNRDQDLLTVAEQLVRDEAGAVGALIEAGVMHRAHDADASRWQDGNSEFWAVVVAPWVLVQESGDRSNG